MKRLMSLATVIILSAFALAGCAPTATTPQQPTTLPGTGTTTTRTPPPFKMVNKDTVYLHVTKTYDPANFPKAALDGEPSQIPFFKPTHDEGKVNRDYPAYDAKTFKFLSLVGGTLPSQQYYMFDKAGSSLNLNKAVAKTGYKFANILDEGHIKILPNLYLGYYDFAWIPLNVMTEYWSGNESMNQELWRNGDDYVVVGASYDGGISMLVPPTVTSLKDLSGKTVGIMNPAFNIESMFNKKLSTVGMATASAGGDVNIQMASPGFVLNDLMAMKNSGVFAWSIYATMVQKQQGYHELVNWKDMGYGTKVPYFVLVARKDIVAKHPDIVQTVVQLNYDATKQSLTVKDYEKPTLAAFTAFKSKYMGYVPAVAPGLYIPDAQANPVFMKDVVDYMTKCGYFKTPYTYSQLVDDSFYAKVKK
jgi:ABC-type nitrate/sulfonate/bicarbonate transport system substrate-binding protein